MNYEFLVVKNDFHCVNGMFQFVYQLEFKHFLAYLCAI